MAIQSISLPVRGMTCGNCARSVERKLAATPGVRSAKVDLASNTATVEYDPERAQAPDLVSAITQLGYEVPA